MVNKHNHQQHLPKSGGSVVQSKLCATIKVRAWLTVKCFEIVTFGKLQNIIANGAYAAN